MTGLTRIGLFLLCWLLTRSTGADTLPTALQTCYDAAASLAAMQREATGLRGRLAAFDSVANDSFAAGKTLEEVLPPTPLARATAEVPAWSGQTDCDDSALQSDYRAAREDLLSLREQVAAREELWNSRPEAFDNTLRAVWESRQRLQGAYNALLNPPGQEQASLPATMQESLRALQTGRQGLRIGLFKLLPRLDRRVTVDDVEALIGLWERSLVPEPVQDIPGTEGLPASLQRQVTDYLQLARLDGLVLSDASNRLRAWVREHHHRVMEEAQAAQELSDMRLLALEGMAVRNALRLLVAETRLAERNSDGSALGTAYEVARYLMGLLAFPLLVLLCRRLGEWTAALQSRLASGARRRRITLQFSRFTASLQLLLPWLAGLLGLALLERLFDRWNLPGLIPLAHLARLYIVYGLLYLSAEWLLQRVAQQAGVFLTEEQIRATNRQARFTAGLIVLPWLLLDLIDLAIGNSLLQDLSRWLTLVTLLLALGILLRSRREDFIAALQSILPESLDPWVDRVLGGRVLFVIFAPVTAPALLLALFGSFLHKGLIDYDWYRKLFARSFKLRTATAEIEAAVSGSEPDNVAFEQYRQWFLADDAAQETPFIDSGLLATVRARMDPWLADRTEENTLLLTGDRGAGKSRVLLRLEQLLAEEQPGILVRRVEIPAKTLSAQATLALIGQVLETDLSDGPAALVKSDERRQPTVVILDNVQNFFLRQVGGFDALDALLRLTNSRLRNIFWLVVINRQSWAYLSNAYGGDYQFRNRVIAKPFSQNDIRSLILSRNHLSGCRIRYDDILIATRGPEAGNIRNAEQLYFSLLWDASLGNPRLALHLWLTSVRMEGRQVVVGLPATVSGATLEQLSNELHFVYAAIVIHENVTSEELVAATALSENLVRSALKTAFDAGFVERSEQRRYRILPLWYPVITRLLARKNLLHG